MSEIPIMRPKISCEKRDCKKSTQCKFSVRKIHRILQVFIPTLAVRLNKIQGTVKVDCRDFEGNI